ncbi:MAG: hypothetical protein QM758_18740 [Armatimonas sp.]
MKSKANLLLLIWLLNMLAFGLLWSLYIARNEGTIFNAYMFSFWSAVLLLVAIVVSLFVVKDASYRRAAALTVLAGFGIFGLAGYGASALRTFRFHQDQAVLEKAVAEIRANGESIAWYPVAYNVDVYPRVGEPTMIYFCIAKENGKPCQWYRWTKKVFPVPAKPPKTTAKQNKKKLHYYWLAPQWAECTRI